MQLLKTVGMIIFGIQLSAVALADPHNMGAGGHGSNFPARGSLGLPTSHPPGLKTTPSGLAKQNKIPSGWSHGVKKGWRCSMGLNGQTCRTPKGKICTRVNRHGHFSCV